MHNLTGNKIAFTLLLAGLLLFATSCSSGGGFQQRDVYTRIDVFLDGLKPEGGRVYVALFYDKEGFESKNDAAAGIHREYIGSTAHVVFTGDFFPGRYAVAAFHDENRNGQLDTYKNSGIPREGIGISNVESFVKGLPTWDTASFPTTAEGATVHVRMLYP